jgi:hypothetical protein
MNNLIEMVDRLTIEEIGELLIIFAIINSEYEERGKRIPAAEAMNIRDEHALRFVQKNEDLQELRALLDIMVKEEAERLNIQDEDE